MNRFEKRKLKRNIYKHANAIMYTCIFVMASIITIAAAAGRTDKITYVDEKQLASSGKEAVEIQNSAGPKVAATVTEAVEMSDTESVEPSDAGPVETSGTMEETDATNTIEETINMEETQPQSPENEATVARITTDTLKVRAEASLESDVLGLASLDEEYAVIAQDGEWIEIEFEGGEGFIHSEFAEISE